MSDLPRGWHWGAGEVAGDSKTYWFYTNLRFQYEGQIYTDPGQPWTVAFYPETGLRDDGDIEVSEYAEEYRQFDSQEKAMNWAVKQAAELHDPYDNN